MGRILTTNFHPKGGGGHIPYIDALIATAADHKHVMGVAAPVKSQVYQRLFEREYPHLYPCDFPTRIRKEPLSVLRSMRTFRRIVKDFKPDIVHTNGGELWIVLLSYPISRHFQVIRTHHAVRSIPNDFRHKRTYARAVNRNIFVSKPALELSTATGIRLLNAVVIQNGVDVDRFRPIPKDATLAARLGLEKSTLCFGSCAGTTQYKRVDVIIKAAAQLKRERNFKILAIGDASQGKRLEKLARELGVDQFIYCGYHTDVTPYVSLFDVGYVLSDSIETISFAAREMMAMGKPLLSSSYSGLRENVSDGLDGFLVEPGNVDATAAAMKKFLAMKTEELEVFSARARERAVAEFSIGKMMQSHALLYETLLGRVPDNR